MEAWRAPASKRRPGCLRVWHRWCVWQQTCRLCRQAGASARNGRSCHRCYRARPRSCAPQRRRAWRASCAGVSATQLCQAARTVEPAPAGHAAGNTRRALTRLPLLTVQATRHNFACQNSSTAPALREKRPPICVSKKAKVCLLRFQATTPVVTPYKMSLKTCRASRNQTKFLELQELQMAFTTRGAAGLQGHTCLLPARGLQHLAPASQAAIYRSLSSRQPALRDAVTCYAVGAKVQPFLQPGLSCSRARELHQDSKVGNCADALSVHRSVLRRWRQRRLRLRLLLQTMRTMTA